MSDSETIRRMEISVSEPRGGSRVQSMGMDLCLVIIQNVLENGACSREVNAQMVGGCAVSGI